MKIFLDNWKVILCFMIVTVLVSLPFDWLVQVNETLALMYLIVPVASVSLSVIQFLAVNGLGNGAEVPHRSPLTVQFLLSFLAQFVLRNKSGHDHQLPSHGVRKV